MTTSKGSKSHSNETPNGRRTRHQNPIKEEISPQETPVQTPQSSGRKRKRENLDDDHQELQEQSPTKPKQTPKRQRQSNALDPADSKSLKTNTDSQASKAASNKRKTPKAEVQDDEEKPEIGNVQTKTKAKRKTKEQKEADAMPLAARTLGLKYLIGAHVSCAKGVQNSVTNSVHIGGNAFAMFLKSQRKWENPPLQDEHRDNFKSSCSEHKYDASQHVLPHGSYLVNLAQSDPEKAAQAYTGFIDDLHRCDALGIKYYNFHPGNTGSQPRPAAISRIADALNRSHQATRAVMPVLETMATPGSNAIGSTFEDLRDIIAEVQNKARIGVCLDTCHVFAAGYDLRQPKDFKSTLQKFDDIIGLKYLKALHLNDSKAPLGAGRDLHQNIGVGFLGLRAFHNVVNEPRFEGLPLILETPIDHKDENGKDVEDKGVWAKEIKMLESLIGMDAESQEFRGLEASLAEKGATERSKYQEAFQRKKDKIEKGQTKLSFGRKGKKKAETDSESDG